MLHIHILTMAAIIIALSVLKTKTAASKEQKNNFLNRLPRPAKIISKKLNPSCPKFKVYFQSEMIQFTHLIRK